MCRFVVSGRGIAAAALMSGFIGCGGGGVDEGVPKDLTPGADINSVKLQPTKNVPGVGAPPGTGTAPDTTPPKN